MAITPTSVTGAILAAGPELKGVSWTVLAAAVGTAIATWAVVPSNIQLAGVTSGAGGVGVVYGSLKVIPAPLPVPAAAVGVGLLGVVTPSMMRAIGMGAAIAFNAASYQGVSTGVGAGTDVSKVTSVNAPALIATLQAVLNASGLLGVNVPFIANSVGTGVASIVLTGTGLGVVTGPAGPAPTAGTSISLKVS